MDIRIETMIPNVRLTVADADTLALAFFQHDPSSAHPNSYDNWVLKSASPPNRIVVGDVTAINTTMAARSPLEKWIPFTQSQVDLPELAAIDSRWDLFETPESAWRTAQASQRIEELLSVVMGSWRNASVSTKVLHAKRPYLFPVLDSYVVQILGGYPNPDAHAAAQIIAHLREQGRANLPALQAIQQRLAMQGYQRSLVRIADALLWLSHPGAWGSRAYKHLTSTEMALAVQ